MAEAKKKKSLLQIFGPKGTVYEDVAGGRYGPPLDARTLKKSHADSLKEDANSPIQGESGEWTPPNAHQDYDQRGKPSKLALELQKRGGGRTAEMPGTPNGYAQGADGTKTPIGIPNPNMRPKKEPGNYLQQLLIRKRKHSWI